MRNYVVNQFYVGMIIGLMFLGIIHTTFISRSQETSILYNEIHTINPPGNLLIIDALSFKENWYYELSFEVVSPHNCQTNISIVDPDGFNYQLYSGPITSELKSILFGAASTRAYSLIIEFKTTETLNFRVHVKVIGEICENLQISGRMIQTHAFRFLPNDSKKEISFLLEKNDACLVYLFPITPLQAHSYLSLNVALKDPNEQAFSFYQGMMEDMFDFEFQTNYKGNHSLIMEIGSLESPLNLMVIVVLRTKNSEVIYSVPLEAQLYSGIILLSLLLVSYFILRKVE